MAGSFFQKPVSGTKLDFRFKVEIWFVLHLVSVTVSCVAGGDWTQMQDSEMEY